MMTAGKARDFGMTPAPTSRTAFCICNGRRQLVDVWAIDVRKRLTTPPQIGDGVWKGKSGDLWCKALRKDMTPEKQAGK
jgi:hypothetical protein